MGSVVRMKQKQADPIRWCSTGVFVCLSLLLWFTDTDVAEPILLVILCWIRAPGDPEEPSTPAASSSSLGSQTEEDIHAWVRLLFSTNHEGFAATKIESRLSMKRLKGPRLRRFLSSRCMFATAPH